MRGKGAGRGKLLTGEDNFAQARKLKNDLGVKKESLSACVNLKQEDRLCQRQLPVTWEREEME